MHVGFLDLGAFGKNGGRNTTSLFRAFPFDQWICIYISIAFDGTWDAYHFVRELFFLQVMYIRFLIGVECFAKNSVNKMKPLFRRMRPLE